ncbi:MAG: FAD binding domain-containing protein [Deltaproteobacteria bacterium]|nr:FAD binding domain-containing protein [Deltaproteobacteria bacterium]
MKLPTFAYHRSNRLEDTLNALHQWGPEAKILAGGTDLIVSLKQRLLAPKILVSLRDLDELRSIREDPGELVIGATTTLQDLIDSERVALSLPALRQAARSVGSRSIQHLRGTVGGNLCQQTRCMYYNQSEFWRSARNPCYKLGGQTCFAEEKGQKCRSVCQSDLAPALLVYSAMLKIVGKNSERLLPLNSFYTGEGERPFDLAPHELLSEIRLSVPPPHSGANYQKLRFRSSIDYPIASAACALSLRNEKLDTFRLAVGALSAAPLMIRDASTLLQGKAPNEQRFQEAARMAEAQAKPHPVDNVGSTAAYRQNMVRVLALRAMTEALKTAQGA